MDIPVVPVVIITIIMIVVITAVEVAVDVAAAAVEVAAEVAAEVAEVEVAAAAVDVVAEVAAEVVVVVAMAAAEVVVVPRSLVPKKVHSTEGPHTAIGVSSFLIPPPVRAPTDFSSLASILDSIKRRIYIRTRVKTCYASIYQKNHGAISSYRNLLSTAAPLESCSAWHPH
jgi:hypothetical protein